MNDLRDGDRIRCVKSAGTLKAGKTYTVLTTRRFPDGVILKEEPGEWFPWRFERVETSP